MPRFRIALALLVSLGILTSCAAMRGRKEIHESGFLGDYSRLEPNPNFPAQEIYINPRAVWARYDSVKLDSVTLWANEDTGALSEEERQMITDLMYKSLHNEFEKHFKLKDRPSPSTIRGRAAITQAKGANVAARTLSTFLPQAMIIGSAVSLGVDTATTVGSATIEVELLDSVTNERLAAAVDSRAGTKDLTSGRTFQSWGDVEAATEFWAQKLSRAMIRFGVRRKPGAPSVDES